MSLQKGYDMKKILTKEQEKRLAQLRARTAEKLQEEIDAAPVHQIPHVVAVEHKDGCVLEVLFSNDNHLEVDLSDLVQDTRHKKDSTAAMLREPDFFKRVEVDTSRGCLVWPNKVDIAPDYLYSLALQQNELKTDDLVSVENMTNPLRQGHGGARKNPGRKELDASKKRKQRSISLNPEADKVLNELVTQLGINRGKVLDESVKLYSEVLRSKGSKAGNQYTYKPDEVSVHVEIGKSKHPKVSVSDISPKKTSKEFA